jgi:hypothetical protein
MPGSNNQYILHGILLDGPTWIGQLEDVTPAQNVDELISYAGGATVPSFVGGNQVLPRIEFSTTQIKTILDTCTSGDGVSCKDYSAANVDLFYRKLDNFGTTDAIGTASHLRIRAVRSLMYWTRIEARQGAPATIDVVIVPTYDGSNKPLQGLGAQTIAANINVADQFTLGPVKLNGSWIDGVQGWTFDQGLSELLTPSDGQVHATFCGLHRSQPVLTIDTPDLGQWPTLDDPGLSVTALIAFLTKKHATALSNVADATVEHIRFTAQDNPAGLAYIDRSTGGGNGPATAPLRIPLRISTSSTLHPFAVSTGAAIA